LQSDAVVIVEGNEDESRLRALFPVEMSRCRVVIAGDVSKVMNACSALERVEQVLPWICVRDRDLLSDFDAQEMASRHPNLHIWSGRMLENELLDPDLVMATFERVGKKVTRQEVVDSLRIAADKVREEVLSELVSRELANLHPVNDVPTGTGKLEKLRAYCTAKAADYQARADQFDDVLTRVEAGLDARWDREWSVLAHGKPLMAAIQRLSPFGTITDLVDALTATFVHGTCQPEGLSKFGERLVALVNA
jgi:hypothetical protein